MEAREHNKFIGDYLPVFTKKTGKVYNLPKTNKKRIRINARHLNGDFKSKGKPPFRIKKKFLRAVYITFQRQLNEQFLCLYSL